MDDFVKGLFLETKTNQWGGEYIKASINVEKIFENPLNQQKYLNFMIFKSKSGQFYAKLSKKPEQTQQANNNIVAFSQLDDEIPF